MTTDLTKGRANESNYQNQTITFYHGKDAKTMSFEG